MRILVPVFAIIVTGCQHTVRSQAEIKVFGSNISKTDYNFHFKKHSSHREYSGLENIFQMKAKFLSYKTLELINRKKASIYQWDTSKLEEQILKTNSTAASSSTVFISFYSRKLPDLKDWEVTIEVGDAKYKASLMEKKEVFGQVFPFHDDWSKGYYAKFLLPTTKLESDLAGLDVKLIVTSKIGGGFTSLH